MIKPALRGGRSKVLERSIKHNFCDYVIARVVYSCPGRNCFIVVFVVLIDTPSCTTTRIAVVIIVEGEGTFIFALHNIGFLRT